MCACAETVGIWFNWVRVPWRTPPPYSSALRSSVPIRVNRHLVVAVLASDGQNVVRAAQALSEHSERLLPSSAVIRCSLCSRGRRQPSVRRWNRDAKIVRDFSGWHTTLQELSGRGDPALRHASFPPADPSKLTGGRQTSTGPLPWPCRPRRIRGLAAREARAASGRVEPARAFSLRSGAANCQAFLRRRSSGCPRQKARCVFKS